VTDSENQLLKFMQQQFDRNRVDNRTSSIIVGLTVLVIATIEVFAFDQHAMWVIESGRCQCRAMRVEANNSGISINVPNHPNRPIADSLAEKILISKGEINDVSRTVQPVESPDGSAGSSGSDQNRGGSDSRGERP
jgi:hypothetical protein